MQFFWVAFYYLDHETALSLPAVSCLFQYKLSNFCNEHSIHLPLGLWLLSANVLVTGFSIVFSDFPLIECQPWPVLFNGPFRLRQLGNTNTPMSQPALRAN